MSSNEASLINSDGILNSYNEPFLRLDSDISVEEATNIEFLLLVVNSIYLIERNWSILLI